MMGAKYLNSNRNVGSNGCAHGALEGNKDSVGIDRGCSCHILE